MSRELAGTQGRWRGLALALSLLSLLTALSMSALVAPAATDGGRVWLLVGWLGVPAVGTLWAFVSNRRVPNWLVFVLIFSLATSIGALVAELVDPGSEREVGPMGVMTLVGLHAAASLMAAGPRRRSR